jgi:hypothetical protein
MPTEPGRGRPIRRKPPAKPKDDGFVVFEVDGFAQLTPEQRTWPVVQTGLPEPKPVDPPSESDAKTE